MLIREIHAGCKAGLDGEKAHTAGPTLERDDSAMEEAWVCCSHLLVFSWCLKLHVIMMLTAQQAIAMGALLMGMNLHCKMHWL